MAFPAEEKKAVQVYVIHRGDKNEKVKGTFREVENKELGQTWLVGEQIMSTYQVRGETMEVKKQVRIETTGLRVSRSK